MPTFGQTGNNTSSTASSSNKTLVSQSTPASTGVVDAAAARMWIDSGSTTARYCIYADSSGEPGALLAQSDTITVSNNAESELAFVFSGANRITVTSGTAYWHGPSWTDPGTQSINLSRQGTAAGRREVNVYTPSPFGTGTSATGPIDAYVTYLTEAADDGAFFEFF